MARPLKPGSYLALKRKWNPGDRVNLVFPMTVKWIQRSNKMVSTILGLKDADGKRKLDSENNTDLLYALTRGPVVYTFDTVWQDFAKADSSPVSAEQVGVDLKKGANPEECPAPPRALGPALELELITLSGKPIKVRMLPFANIGKWYSDAARKPPLNSRAFTYATWIPDSSSKKFREMMKTAEK